jgi:lipopolysaccharide/colanic/teichoic acid biosynthesis glycosyltransferase
MLRRPLTNDFNSRRLPSKRSLQSLLTPEQMNIAIQRESARADRNGGEFALVLFRAQNNEPHSLSSMRLAKTVLRRVRATDDLGWYDDQHIAALLPDTSAAGAWRFADQVCMMLSRKAPRPLCSVYSYPTKWFNGDDSGGGGNGDASSSNENGNGNVLTRGVEIGADGRPLGVGNLIPYFLDGVKSGLDQRRSPVQRMEQLLVRPLPLWKRAIDVAGSLVGMLLASPFMIVAAVLIKFGSKGPIIFAQQRAGLGGKPFTIYKFRTMVVDAEEQKAALRKLSEQDGPAFKLTNDPRITRVGAFLRKTSIDELPQLWNVFRGDMTLVGPRPLPVGESDACERWHRRRLDVTPGLTCIWQVKGRSKVSFSEWVRMDVAYIRRRTLWNDIRILVETIPAVILRKGAR